MVKRERLQYSFSAHLDSELDTQLLDQLSVKLWEQCVFNIEKELVDCLQRHIRGRVFSHIFYDFSVKTYKGSV